MLLVGVCCREGFVTLPEVCCKHWEGIQTLPYLWQWDEVKVINTSLLVEMGEEGLQTLPYSFLCFNGCLLGFLANLQAIQCV